jgi:general secretion pathway protein L
MIANFFAWWIARMAELLPRSLTQANTGASGGIVVGVDPNGNVAATIRRGGRQQPLTLGAAARLAGRRPISLRPPPSIVLEKHHIVPAASRRELDQMLRYELPRITPFQPRDLFWRWDAHPRPGDKSRIAITLTMVPKAALAAALDVLATAGIKPAYIEAGPPERPTLLPVDDQPRSGNLLGQALAWTCAGLAIVALLLPVALQEVALWSTDNAIEDLRPAIAQVEALRRGITADGATRQILAKELQHTGDVLQILATITRILPDDTFLTDFSLHERQILLSGRSAAATRLITGLSADPAIRDAAFAAPVTRVEGATTDVFAIRATIAP